MRTVETIASSHNFDNFHFRTASDLEEIGMIDKYQKGYIKDLIISGDSTFQAILEKYEKGDKKELEGAHHQLCSRCMYHIYQIY